MERDAIELVVEGRTHALPGLAVRRTLPTRERRHVGPFVFLDHMGPADLAAGAGIDVPPHPHIGLATVTYLLEGALLHRDSLGTEQRIEPGDVNWMSAGRGIAHSERTPADARGGARIHGIQSWVALPIAHEESAPTFEHVPAARIPVVTLEGAELHVIAGSAHGATSPVAVLSPLFYVYAALRPGARVPLPEQPAERAAHIVAGRVECDGRSFEAGTLVVFRPGSRPDVRAVGEASLVLLGGAPLDAERHIWWNFVSSSKERIERAKRDWKEGRFGVVPGDPGEPLPLP